MHIQNLFTHLSVNVLISFISFNLKYTCLISSYMPGPIFHTVQVLTHLSITKTLWVGAIINHILQIRNLRHRLGNVLKVTQQVSAGAESESRFGTAQGRIWPWAVSLQGLTPRPPCSCYVISPYPNSRSEAN